MLELLDEQQLEAHSSLFKWKSFEAKDSAKMFLAENGGWYGVVEAKGKFWVWSSIVLDVYQQATAEVSKIFKLNVPLAIEPAIGKNWKDCH